MEREKKRVEFALLALGLGTGPEGPFDSLVWRRCTFLIGAGFFRRLAPKDGFVRVMVQLPWEIHQWS